MYLVIEKRFMHYYTAIIKLNLLYVYICIYIYVFLLAENILCIYNIHIYEVTKGRVPIFHSVTLEGGPTTNFA